MKDAGSLAVLCIRSSSVPVYGRKKSTLNEGACPNVPGKRHYSYFSLLSSGLQSKNIRVISSGFAGPYKPGLAVLSRGHSELWLHLPMTNYLDVLHLMKTNGLCNSCDRRCAAFQPTCYRMCPIRMKEGCAVHGLSDSSGC